MRGLEYQTPEGAAKRRLRKYKANAAVLTEQYRQRQNMGNVDDESIRMAYTQETSDCVQEAVELGKRDEEEALNIHRNIDDQQQKHSPAFVAKRNTSLFYLEFFCIPYDLSYS
mmetsp:Transcript_32374/g.74367  ORF Transcript_32374/g.74367 Transcript_32374/m.74367 type:complete len:113 (-) Transcript_32374:337-675(-)